jgi:hypothetical protein
MIKVGYFFVTIWYSLCYIVWHRNNNLKGEEMTIQFKKLTSGNKVTHYKGRAIVVSKTESGDWLAETRKTVVDSLTGCKRYEQDCSWGPEFYDYAKTRKAAVEMVMFLIDEITK